MPRTTNCTALGLGAGTNTMLGATAEMLVMLVTLTDFSRSSLTAVTAIGTCWRFCARLFAVTMMTPASGESPWAALAAAPAADGPGAGAAGVPGPEESLVPDCAWATPDSKATALHPANQLKRIIPSLSRFLAPALFPQSTQGTCSRQRKKVTVPKHFSVIALVCTPPLMRRSPPDRTPLIDAQKSYPSDINMFLFLFESGAAQERF